ncbi:MAG: hypothetical protein NTW54_09765 [Bacteroidetes bacterium]|nr:hypothetical protein [Bacteroidota bacterium]
MDNLEFEILDALYFMEPFETIVKEVSEKRLGVVTECLRKLIKKRYVQVMEFNEAKQEFLSTPFFDFDHVEEFRFMATKTGLTAHNSK